jgi:hypothetical protein
VPEDGRTAERQSGRVERIARNEAAFRESNEQIDALNAAGAKLSEYPIVCECGANDCLDVITVSARQYNEVRTDPNRFLVKPGHAAPDVESVVARYGEFDIVEKHPGKAQRITEETDPRRNEGAGVDNETARRIAENEARFRDANEHIEKAVLRLEPDAPSLPFVCECGRAECLQTIRLTIKEYEDARVHPHYFVCAPTHEITGPGLGRVVRDMGKYVIVEKLGEAGAVAEERYPRS